MKPQIRSHVAQFAGLLLSGGVLTGVETLSSGCGGRAGGARAGSGGTAGDGGAGGDVGGAAGASGARPGSGGTAGDGGAGGDVGAAAGAGGARPGSGGTARDGGAGGDAGGTAGAGGNRGDAGGTARDGGVGTHGGKDASLDAPSDASPDASSDAGSDAVAPFPYDNKDNGLLGNSNYLIYSNCQALQNPSAEVTLTAEMNAGAGGFDFQFNANSLATRANPYGATLAGQASSMGWQQYIMNVRAGSTANTTDVWGFIEPWPSKIPNVANGANLANTTDTPFHLVTLTQTPTPTLPAGTKLSITLETDLATTAVTSLIFSIALPPGTPTDSSEYATYYNGISIPLVGIPRSASICGNAAKSIPPDPRFCPDVDAGPGNIVVGDLTPVTSFQMNFAGLVMNSAAGTIVYSASATTPLFPAPPSVQKTTFPHVPTCSAGAITAETSNVVYSSMGVDGDPQSFDVQLDCQPGTQLYFFDCDYKPFCATQQNAATCVGNSWCFPYPWTKVQASGRGECKDVTAFEKRDPEGNWLATVQYPSG